MPPKPFNPPRPKSAGIKKTTAKSTAANKKAATSTAATKRKATAAPKKSKSARAPDTVDEEDEDSDPFASAGSASIDSGVLGTEVDAAEDVLEVVEEEEDVERATIPPELLTRLLHEFFQQDGTRIAKDANAAIGKYVEIFARESFARCVWLKKEQAEEGGRIDDGFCEVEDLEKLAPQLLLDF